MVQRNFLHDYSCLNVGWMVGGLGWPVWFLPVPYTGGMVTWAKYVWGVEGATVKRFVMDGTTEKEWSSWSQRPNTLRDEEDKNMMSELVHYFLNKDNI